MDIEGYKFVNASQKDVKKYSAMYGASIRISRYTYKIKWMQSINDGQVAGLCHPKEKTIYIALEQLDIEKTLVHEIMHAEIEAAGLWSAHGFSRDLEEIMCELASHAALTNYVLRKR